MVEKWEEGGPDVFQVLRRLASNGRRFPDLPSTEAEEKQLGNREKIIFNLMLPSFDVKDERTYEEWVDRVAMKIKSTRLCLQLLREAWESLVPEEIGIVVAGSTSMTYEGLVDEVAKALYPTSRYVGEVETILFNGSRKESVLQANQWLVRMSARYLRLCSRRNRMVGITSDRMVDSVVPVFRLAPLRLVQHSSSDRQFLSSCSSPSSGPPFVIVCE
eukprot:Trichotokara_eunicae@DN7867_c0_g1_i1.p1